MNAGEDQVEAQQAALTAVLGSLAPGGILLGCRRICPGDQALLLPEEALSLTVSYDAARDASGAARHVARQLVATLERGRKPIVRSAAGAPLWPAGLVGSLAHDDHFAVAAVARVSSFSALGIDVEPAEPLPADVASIVRMAGDVTDGVEESLASRALFSAKEAVYKAVFPRDGIILGYEDIAINLSEGRGTTRTGRSLWLVFVTTPCIVVVAYEPA